jgi:hypothetical protein
VQETSTDCQKNRRAKEGAVGHGGTVWGDGVTDGSTWTQAIYGND